MFAVVVVVVVAVLLTFFSDDGRSKGSLPLSSHRYSQSDPDLLDDDPSEREPDDPSEHEPDEELDSLESDVLNSPKPPSKRPSTSNVKPIWMR